MKRVILAILILLLAPDVGSSQAPLAEGARIRIKQAPAAVWVGTLQAITADSLTIVDLHGTRFSLARQNLELERSIGRERKFWKHFGITVAGGAVVGGLISALSWTECTETGFLACFMVPESRTEAFGLGFAAGGIIGLPVGVLLGSLIKVEQWEKVATQP